MTGPEKSDKTIREWLDRVSQAATCFERRWTEKALRRVDPGLARRLRDQRDKFAREMVTGSVEDVEKHGAAMCRGWQAAVTRMEAAGESDDAYLVGYDHRTGLRVAIGHQKAAAERVGEIEGNRVVHVTPDEVAAILGGLEGFKALSAIKRLFPGAEVVDTHSFEPAQSDHMEAAE